MSLAIDPDAVTHVLLADGWHDVKNSSFDLDSYEFITADGDVLHDGGNVGVCATGFSFTTADGSYRLSGPLTAILAVRTDENGSESSSGQPTGTSRSS